MTADPDERRAELAGALAALERRLVAACVAVDRPREDVTLVAVTKTWPSSDIVMLHALGVRDMGENRDAEAARKAAELTALGLRWHFVGQVQSRKARSVAAYADVVHSLDRTSLATALSTGAQAAGRTIDVLVQVRLDDDGPEDGDASRQTGVDGAGVEGEESQQAKAGGNLDGEPAVVRGLSAPGRGGTSPAEAGALADLAASLAGLRLAGVMAVPPRGVDPVAAYRRLAEVAACIRASHPTAAAISAGMSADLEAAVAAGATHVRVGTALLGRRPAPLG